MKIDILVLNYNGKELLERFLPSVVEAARSSYNLCNVIVVDNSSTDGSAEFVKSRFPSVALYQAKDNRVLFTYNDVVRDLDSDIVIFLNNDIRVEKDFVDILSADLKDESVFFSAPKVLNPDNTYNGGRSRLEFKWGIIKSVTEKDRANERGANHFISCGAFRRKTFLELGGFDDLYMPGIWEDVDICYRGLKSGLKGIYNPKSIIWHDESTTFKKIYGNNERMIFAHRNMFLFFWKNITDPGMVIGHIMMLIPAIISAFIKNNKEFISGFLRALPRLNQALARRKNTYNKDYAMKDRDIISWNFYNK